MAYKNDTRLLFLFFMPCFCPWVASFAVKTKNSLQHCVLFLFFLFSVTRSLSFYKSAVNHLYTTSHSASYFLLFSQSWFPLQQRELRTNNLSSHSLCIWHILIHLVLHSCMTQQRFSFSLNLQYLWISLSTDFNTILFIPITKLTAHPQYLPSTYSSFCSGIICQGHEPF